MPARPACLTHGDFWEQTILATSDGSPAVIDPAVSYKWADVDVAHLWSTPRPPQAERFFAVYGELLRAEPGWTDRLAYVQLRQHLALMAMFDDDWGSTDAVRGLVAPFRRTGLQSAVSSELGQSRLWSPGRPGVPGAVACSSMCCARPGELPADVLDDVASAFGAEVTLLRRLPGGVNGGAAHVWLDGGADAVLKAVPRAHPHHVDEVLRAQRVVEHMRGCGYPTPAWLGVGSTATHVWHLMDFVDAAPAHELTPSLVEQLMGIIELQAGRASEPYDHWSYAWLVAAGQEAAVAGLGLDETPEQSGLRRSIAGLSGYSPAVSALVERLRLVCADVSAPPKAPDMVHADLATPSNVLVRGGAVVAVVDIGNAGSGTRAIDLTALGWYAFQDPLLDGVRERLWTRVLDLVGWDGAAVLAASHVLHMLEIPIRKRHHDDVPGAVERGHLALDELGALR